MAGGRLHLTSLGELFLAAASAADVRVYAQRSDTVRRLDLAYDNEEAEIGLRCVASPICNDEGIVVAGLSIAAPTDRHDPAWAAQVKRSADEISRALGYRQPAAG